MSLVGRAFGEEQQVGLDAGVGIEHAVGQPDDRVQVALVEQPLLDPRLDAFAEQRAVGQHDRAASAGFEQMHDQHQEQVGRFAGLKRLGKVELRCRLLPCRRTADW